MSYVLIHETIFVTSIVHAIYCFSHGMPFQMPFNLELFVNTNKSRGFGLLCCCELMVGLTYALTVASITSYFVCCCLYIEAICNHFKSLINAIKRDVELLNGGNKKLRLKIKTKYLRAIELHINILE